MPYLFGAGNQKEARIGPSVLPTSISVLFTLSEPLLFKSVVLSNTTAGPLNVNLHVVAVDVTPSAATLIVPTVTVPSTDTLTYSFGEDGIPMLANETIQGHATGAGVNITMVVSRRNR